MNDVRRILDKLIQAALRAADPQEAIRRHVRRDGNTLYVDQRQYDLAQFDDIRLVAAGKAAMTMATEVARLLGERLTRVVVVTKYGHVGKAEEPQSYRFAPSSIQAQIIEAGHPIPDDNSLRGGLAVCAALENCGQRTLVIACVSGGASALLVAPHNPISLNTLRALNDALLRSGADIREMNAVRSRLDRLKGGGLVRLAQPAQVIGLILSDVIGDPLDVIASGLTHEPHAHNVLVGNNTQSCNAVADAARDLGLTPHVMTTELRGEARDAGTRIAREALSHYEAPVADEGKDRAEAEEKVATPSSSSSFSSQVSPTVLIYGGETTVTIRGEGKGGRNQELALAAALALNGQPRTVAIAALGTDGTDGPTDAAGALAFNDTVQRGRQVGLDAADFLRRNDSYRYFEPLGDLIMTGPTGTNVADVVIALTI